MYRVCERFGFTPEQFENMNFEHQRHLLAFERVRQQEDIPQDAIG